MSKLCEVFDYNGEYGKAVRVFAKALGMTIKEKKDYRLLTDLQYAETEQQFAQFLQDFSRQYEVYCHASDGEKFKDARPGEQIIETIVKATQFVGVRIVRAALISYALTYLTEEDKKRIEKKKKTERVKEI